VLTHVTNTMQAMAKGAPVDLVFQSIGGTQATNTSFGINLALLDEAHADGPGPGARHAGRQRHVLRDRPGQRPVGQRPPRRRPADLRGPRLRRGPRYKPLLVNTVVGFIGPEYLYDGKQIIRAGLEDHFCGKLLGLPMGCDICYTNHAEADQDDMDNLLVLLGAAGVNFIMGVPGADDVMLNYQSTSFHDALFVRKLLGLTLAQLPHLPAN
jgi:ethanolamine ammonia-lyase large subunit